MDKLAHQEKQLPKKDMHSVQDRIRSETGHTAILYELLSFCTTPRSMDEMHKRVEDFSTYNLVQQPAPVLATWLMQAGGLEQTGSSTGQSLWITTEAGQECLAAHDPANQLTELVKKYPDRHATYLCILQNCETPKTREEIEILLKNDNVPSSPQLYASTYIGELEKAGGLKWKGKWCTTTAGKEFLR